MCIKIKCKHVKDDGTECGHKNSIFASFCGGCGTPLNCKQKLLARLMILFLAVLLVAAGLWFYIAHNGDKGPEPIQVSIKVFSQHPEFGDVRGDSTCCQFDTITIMAIAKDGYRFVEWNDGNTDSIRTIVAESDKEYIARFEACKSPVSEPVKDPTNENPEPPVITHEVPKFKISVVSSDPNMGWVTGEGVYDSLAPATIEAIAKEGYRFVSWNDGNKSVKRTIKVIANQSFSANFSEQPIVVPPTQTKDIEVDWNGVATYRGPGHGNQPDGIGKLSFYSDYQLDLKDIKGTKLDIKAGEFVKGAKFVQGKLRQGTLHRKDGSTIWFNI